MVKCCLTLVNYARDLHVKLLIEQIITTCVVAHCLQDCDNFIPFCFFYAREIN